ncbi:MAG: TIGR03118 family protein [Alphaproteobacteria bacterium]|nr:TIGR03118 family protein [Alphaproteobacteria bacterium]
MAKRLLVLQGASAVALLIGVAIAPARATVLFQETDLVSDGVVPATVTDPNLVNPWGVSFGPTSPFWVSNNGTGVATLYGVTGSTVAKTNINPPAGNVVIPPATGSGTAAPTGQVANGTANGFMVNGAPAHFIFDSEDGAISAWSSGANATIVKNNAASGAVYKGLAIDNTGGHLYAANFNSGFVEMYDSSFNLVKSFTDPTVPAGYAPFNTRVLNGQLYVTFALQNSVKHDDIAGPGNGFVDVFNLDGTFNKRLVSMGNLNSPWGLAIAPSSFGQFAGALLVGNFGDGTIGAYNPSTGAFMGTLLGANSDPLNLGDLWTLTAGNGAGAGSQDALYFTTGVMNEADGIFGSITPVNAPGTAVPEPGSILLLLTGLGLVAVIRHRFV